MITLGILAAVMGVAPYKLVWSDEFNAPGPPDPKKWTYEVGFIRNDEKQFYTKDRRENARVEGGNLVIEARKDSFEGHPISSASLTTSGLASWTYGRFEVRAKVPGGKGTWPAIWFLGDNINKVGWPKCGEIDLMEYVGFDPDRLHQNVHTGDYNHMKGTGRGAALPFKDAAKDYHVYVLDWTPESLKFYIDFKPTFELKNDGKGEGSWPFGAPEYLILNLAIGGSWGGQQGIDDSIFPARMLVDYVRIYQATG